MNRREFLAHSAIASGVLLKGDSVSESAADAPQSWRLKFTAEPCSVGVAEGWSVAERVEFLKLWGFAGVHVSRLSGPNEDDLKATSETVSAASMKFVSFTGSCDLWSSDWVASSRAAQQRVRQQLQSYLQLGKQLGAESFTLTPGCWASTGTKTSQRERLCEHLRWCCQLAEHFGVKVLLDPVSFPEWHGKMVLSSLADAVSLAESVNHPLCRVKVQTVHASFSEAQAVIRTHSHLIEMISLGQCWTSDEKDIFFDEMEAMRFPGWIGMHVESR